jgi:hypothetical protein
MLRAMGTHARGTSLSRSHTSRWEDAFTWTSIPTARLRASDQGESHAFFLAQGGCAAKKTAPKAVQCFHFGPVSGAQHLN